MLKVDRQYKIVEVLKAKRRVSSAELCEMLNVSMDTVRRDISELEETGQLKSVRGGASLHTYIPVLSKYETEINKNEYAIAKKALNLVKDGQTIIIGGGSANLQFVNLLPPDINITVFTNSIPIAYKLSEYKNIDGILLGGNISNRFKTTNVDDVTLELLNDVIVDVCFLAVSGVHLQYGLTETSRINIALQRTFIQVSSIVSVLVQSNKLSSPKTYRIGDISCLDILITELDPAEDILKPFVSKGIKVL